ncbi:hypothetical protein JRO89_XS08G0079800 [Xanthoceras sorbifolium]|uniref:LysM domain-containing protein n=1 Tax=Xanthoceras sorbifolium TaxID=99658 RepID=A0ABQ8HP06_9ROSI|nr:hypothetical protein JRO89_XS08G0079800 [Xanthoceras sorbifolium]
MASANRSKATSIFSNFVLIISLLLIIISVVESRSLGDGFLKAKPTPQCNTVVGVASGDTCYDLAKQFKMTTELFYAVNPNINCDALFVGQWVCVAGTA